ncbi:MAG: AAA family ATPase, partial [Chitinophagaceae bacterium]|nr:AAA family ATPase [Chitinophagaceae bacterium]
MLKKLSISNYAIIDELEVQFEKGLNIITGETGAGKSILVGALNLVLGARADSSSLNRKDKKCFVEALFMVDDNDKIRSFFLENDLDPEPELMLRRELSATGKSRSFINDTPVNLGQLRSLSILLVDLHQQFDTLELNKDDFQLSVLDAFAGNESQLKKLQSAFAEYDFIRKELASWKVKQEAAQKEFDYNRFLLDELEKISLSEGELERLEEELKLLSNAETITRQLQTVLYEMEDAEQPVLVQLKSIQQKVQSLVQFVPGMEELAKRIAESLVELRDASQEINRMQQGIRSDPQRMQEVEERISAGF